MATNTKKLLNIAKGKNKGNEKLISKEKQQIKTNEIAKPKSPEEERNLKAKQKVEELLQEINLNPETKKDDLLEISIDKPISNFNKGNEWLSEQVSILTEENERLAKEAEQAKDDYRKIFDEIHNVKGNIPQNNDSSKASIIRLFNEIQENYINMYNPTTGKSGLVIVPIAFLNRLIMFFPFLESEKKY